MHEEPRLHDVQKEWHGNYKSYAIGFIGSLLLTGLSFLLVVLEPVSRSQAIYALIALALIQGALQIVFFLHVGQEPKPRWETLIFCFAVVILIAVVIGTLWIMADLQMRAMPNM